MRDHTKRGLALVAGLAMALCIATPIAAQRGPPMGRRGQAQGQERAQLEQRIRAQMGVMIRRQLGLSEEESSALSEAVQEFETQRQSLAREGQAVRRRVEALTLEGGEDLQEANELLERMATMKRQEAELFAAEQARLLQVLRPIQVLRYYALREQLGERIQRLRSGQRGRGNGNGAGDGAWEISWTLGIEPAPAER